MTTVNRYIVPANSNDEHFNADCDFAVVTFNAALVTQLNRLQKSWLATKKKEKSLSAIEVVEDSVSFIRRSAAEELLGERVLEEMESTCQDKPFLILSDAPYIYVEARSDYLVVTGRGIWWRAHPKHASVSVESNQIDWSWFTTCVHCYLAKEAHVKGKCMFSPTDYKSPCKD